MKKLAIMVFYTLLIATVVVILLPFLTKFYLSHFSYSQPKLDILTSTNYSVQIGYNLIYLITAITVVFVANNQLQKTREATTIQTLGNIDTKLRSIDFQNKRQKLSNYLLNNGVKELHDFLKDIREKKDLNESETKRLAQIKNTFEDVIYQFEFIGYYYYKKAFSLEDIYQLFSIEIQQYWLVMDQLGFVKYLRTNKQNANKDFYDKFETLFNHSLKQEIVSESSRFLSYFLKVYYFFGLYKVFYCLFNSKKNRISRLIKQKKQAIGQFLVEESILVENSPT